MMIASEGECQSAQRRINNIDMEIRMLRSQRRSYVAQIAAYRRYMSGTMRRLARKAIAGLPG